MKAQGSGDRRKAMLEDIADLTGGTVIAEAVPYAGEGVPERSRPGQAHRGGKENPTIIDGAGYGEERSKPALKKIRTQIEEATSDYDREKLQERVTKLAGGVAVMKVGARPKSK